MIAFQDPEVIKKRKIDRSAAVIVEYLKEGGIYLTPGQKTGLKESIASVYAPGDDPEIYADVADNFLRAQQITFMNEIKHIELNPDQLAALRERLQASPGVPQLG